MTCNACGRTSSNEEANYCYYCGSSFREPVHVQVKPIPEPEHTVIESKDKPITFLNWLATYGLLLIPYLGGIAFIAMLIYWSIGNKIQESKKNWARATLIFVIISFIMFIFAFATIMPALIDGGIFDIEGIYAGLKNI